MKIENEIEKLLKRVTLLETQNSRFKNLLDSALEVTKQSLSNHNIQKDESEFLRETIKLIEDEKVRMQEDLELLSSEESETVMYKLRQSENDIVELQKKVDVLIKQLHKQTKEVEQLRKEHAEFKFLLAQPNSTSQLLRNIMQLDSSSYETPNVSLHNERTKLQNKILVLEKKKTDLLASMENLRNPPKKSQTDVKTELERVLFQAIDNVAHREYETLSYKVVELEKERSKLLTELQTVLDSSKREIANEYRELQRKILDIETQKAELQLTISSMKHSTDGIEQIKQEGNSDVQDEKKIQIILNAFSNKPKNEPVQVRGRREFDYSDVLRYIPVNVATCNIL